ncbi:S1C family serine protease [Anaerosphaera multitolerans]|uniref:PDZ domain-containing protein n=1 Tax=Anaerosphaera multitolerans TaxID=2487351 RepID=A0A437S7J4_9FIRM|nr:trypsin-like peptidase domain-containing protein [Anaerosphaera multitolerans]RVU55045.1 PDZ domain-containing protein [Anaerosphaera multitolerans]
MDENNTYNNYEVNSSNNGTNIYNNKKEKKKSGKGIIALALIFAIIGGIIGSSITYFAIGQNSTTTNGGKTPEVNITTSGNTNVATAVAMKAMPSVVGITTSGEVITPFFGAIETQGTGSGIIVDKDGYILTNAHVVSLNNQIVENPQVLLNDGTSVVGKVVWYDTAIDIAIVKIETDVAIQPATLGNSDELQIGEPAIAIGNPIDMAYQRSVTQGIISGLNRYVGQVSGGGYMTGLIQTDASINSGNSGGPLLNQEGEVIGINTVKLSTAEGLGFSIPINSVKNILKQVIETGEYRVVSLGVQPLDATEVQRYFKQNLGVKNGVFVLNAIDGSPAAQAGIKSGDVIIKIDDSDIETVNALKSKLYEYEINDKAEVTVVRGGKEEAIEVTFTEYSEPSTEVQEEEPSAGNQVTVPYDEGSVQNIFEDIFSNFGM